MTTRVEAPPANRRPRRLPRLWLRRALFLLAVLLLWEALARSGLWPDYIFPAPSEVLASLAAGFRGGTYTLGIVGSLGRLIEGYLIATVIGLTLGLLMAQQRWLKETLGMLVMGLQALPSICWLPLALLWFGLNPQAILFVVVMGSVLAIAQATEDGVRNTPPIYLRAARNLGAGGWQLYPYVILPSALPSIITGMKLGWSFAWRSLLAGELLYALPGLGNLLMMGRELNDMAQVMAVMLVIIILGLLTDQLVFGTLERQVRDRWGLLRR
ncbi:MAG TPA: ABC transporter permease [Anaerolineales bacterium]|nr:ABC transporter permease [Anaerolineales bacterium]